MKYEFRVSVNSYEELGNLTIFLEILVESEKHFTFNQFIQICSTPAFVKIDLVWTREIKQNDCG